LTEVDCDDDGGGGCNLCSTSEMTTLTVGDTYFIMVDGFGAAVGTFCMSVFETPDPALDFGTTCDLAHQMYVSSSCTFGSTDGNSGDAVPAVAGGGIDQSCSAGDDSTEESLWMKFTANDATTTVDPVDFTGPNTADWYDISIYTGACGSLTEINCTSTPTKTNSYDVTLVPGTDYYMLVTPGDNYSGTSLRVSVCSASDCTAPTNDMCATPEIITDGVEYSFQTACATADEALCSGSTENNVWMSWTAPATWPVDSAAFVYLWDQDCWQTQATTGGAQMSIYNSTETCATISGGTSECIVYNNSNNPDNFYANFIPIAGETYLINVDGFGGTACTFNFIINDDAPISLFVDLIEFQARKEGNGVTINWTTASEKDNDRFIIERSADGTIFKEIGSVPGRSNSSSELRYSFVDDNPLSGVSYYRLKILDLNGAVEYTRIAAIRFNDAISYNLFPNPAVDQLQVVFNAESRSNMLVRMMDIQGKVVKSEIFISEEGENTLSIFTGDLPRGVYSFVLSDEAFFTTKQIVLVE